MQLIPQRTFFNLVQRFAELDSNGSLDTMRKRKWSRVDTAKTLIADERLSNLSLEEADELYRSLPIAQRKRSEFLDNPIEEIRECLWFLLHEELMYEIRVWEFLDEMGGYRLKGGDLTLTASLFYAKDPDLFGLINTNVDKALKALGMSPSFYKNESQAGRFQKYQDTLLQITRMAGFADFSLTDDFLEALAKGMLKAPAS